MLDGDVDDGDVDGVEEGEMDEKWGVTLVHRSCWMVMLMMVMLMMVMMLMELKRGSTKEKWGLTLIHRTGEGNRIELGVSKVWKFFLGHFHNNLLRWQCSAQPPRPASCLATL